MGDFDFGPGNLEDQRNGNVTKGAASCWRLLVILYIRFERTVPILHIHDVKMYGHDPHAPLRARRGQSWLILGANSGRCQRYALKTTRDRLQLIRYGTGKVQE